MNKLTKVLFENDEYKIIEIPYNHEIRIKSSLQLKYSNRSGDRDIYDTDDNRTVESSKKMAEEYIQDMWVPVNDTPQKRWDYGRKEV